jgi:hypothetical protein
MRRTRVLPMLLALALLGVASAQCNRGPTTSELSIRGFGAAYFEQVRTDSAHDSVEFYGGVCLAGEASAWTMVADRVTITGLGGTLTVRAQNPVLHLEGWTMTASELHGTQQHLAMSAVHVAGKALSGRAATVAVDLQDGSMQLDQVMLTGATFTVRGSHAELRAGGITVTGAGITTCTCAGSPLYEVTGSTAQVAPQGQSVVLHGAELKAGAVTIPLGETVTLSRKTLEDLGIPLKVAYVATDTAAGITGTGLGVTAGPIGVAPGVQADVGATGLDVGYPLEGVALLNGRSPEGTFTIGKAPAGMRFQMTSDHALAPWLDAGFDTRVLEPGNRDELREGVLHARAHTALPAVLRAVHGDAALQLLAAASSQTPSGSSEIMGARLGAQGTLSLTTAAHSWGRVGLRLGVGGSLYPDQHASQWGVDVEPSYGVSLGPVALRASYLARFTNSGSPFTTTLDRLEPTQRPALTASAQGAVAPGWTASSRLAVTYDFVGSPSVDAGLNRFDVGATLTRRLGAWRLSASADAALAGVLAPDGVRDGYVEGGIGAQDGALEFGARARYTTAPDPTGLDLLEVSAAVPVDLPGVTVRPYLALNFAQTVSEGVLPAISGHGLDLTFVTCCGALKLGYRDQDGVWTVTAAVDLKQRTASTQAGAGGCGGQTTAASSAAPLSPGTCSVTSGGTGIMAGAAPGAPPP